MEDLSDVQEMYDLEQEMLASGSTQDEIDTFMLGLRELAFEVASQELRETGLSEEDIVAFWAEFTLGDFTPEDSIDVSDEEFTGGSV